MSTRGSRPPLLLLTEGLSRRARFVATIPVLKAVPLRRVVPGHLRAGPDGPSGVLNALRRGLRELGYVVPVRDSCVGGPESTVVGVLSGRENAKQAALWRQTGQISRLILGPNIAILPSLAPDAGWDVADVILVPSAWVAKAFARDNPAIEHKLRIWPSGIDTNWWSPGHGGRNKALIYDKRKDGSAEHVRECLRQSGRGSTIIRYGEYYPDQYLRALQESEVLVWLGFTESQGLAMFEAWSADVPTVVVDVPADEVLDLVRGLAEAAPYLTTARGIVVPTCDDVVGGLRALAPHGQCAPRASVVPAFGLAARAQAFLELALTGAGR